MESVGRNCSTVEDRRWGRRGTSGFRLPHGARGLGEGKAVVHVFLLHVCCKESQKLQIGVSTPGKTLGCDGVTDI